MRNIAVKNIEFGTVVQEEMLFKGISYLELCWPLSSVDWNHLCSVLVQCIMRNNSMKPFEFGTVDREMLFKDVFI